ncbi:hypothetical protein NBRC10512_000101 [Rhodotorula toruloides]|uniref:RHTO0S09e06084g1_1 n=2 Tax=Rhodotorula toruloides TaxID=5286 RepID=A0A061BC92_RHOTO|nr:uncharacterized protein RHTO_03984 [Rhodotorula toruloides NP11]EMS19940.1 hypothetical protein RHTO_03984 [Rhodotorula toruloides NP11]KAJ8292833.1 hypothetical protein OF846_004096 [Rhodotorula toruloides]CDR44551.1 RHTO0S09e06084g1_1 [Rhodotorula toruloides]
MRSLLPQKRPSPSSTLANGGAPSPADPSLPASKQPRIDSSTASSSAPKRPKNAEIFLKAHEKGAKPFRDAQEHFVEAQFEVEDAASYQEALLAMEGLTNQLHHPNRHHVRLLLSLCFFPLFFKPPEQSSATYARNASRPARPTSTARTRLLTLSDDPIALTHRKIRELAREMLNDVIGTNGAEVVCAAVKGYGLPERRKGGEDEADPFGLAIESKRKAKGKGKAATTDPDYEHPHDSADDPLAVSADRILGAEDLWDVLAGTVAKVPRLRTRERPVLEVGGWEVVRVLVRGWEDEWRKKRGAVGGLSEPPEPLSLLRYFKPSASSGAARELSSKALDIAFWPFSDYAIDLDAEPESDEDDEHGDTDEELLADEKKGRKRQVAAMTESQQQEAWEADGTTLLDKKEVGVKLVGVIGASAVDGYLSGPAVMAELVQRMKALAHEDFVSFVELFSTHKLCTPFTIRLLAAYLETHSHPLAAYPSLLPSSDISSLPNPGSTSPRKLSLHATNSAASLDSNHASGSSSTSSYWRIPSLESSDLLHLIARVPIEVPLPSSAATTSKMTPGLPRTFTRAARAAESHALIKHALVGLLVPEAGLAGTAGRDDALKKLRNMMDRVAEVVEEAKTRVEAANGAAA